MGNVSTTNNSPKGKPMNTPAQREKRIKKTAPVVVAQSTPQPQPPREVRKVKVKPEVVAVATEPAPVAEKRAADAPATPSAIVPKKSKAEIRAEKEKRAATATPADMDNLQNNLLVLDEYGEAVIGQLVTYFGEPFKGTSFDPANNINNRVIMWTRPWRKKIGNTGGEKDGKILSFKRFEISLLGETLHNGSTYFVVYPLDGSVAAAMPRADWQKSGMTDIVTVVPETQPEFDNFLQRWEKVLNPEPTGERRIKGDK